MHGRHWKVEISTAESVFGSESKLEVGREGWRHQLSRLRNLQQHPLVTARSSVTRVLLAGSSRSHFLARTVRRQAEAFVYRQQLAAQPSAKAVRSLTAAPVFSGSRCDESESSRRGGPRT
jgi:hypothetical protein